MLLLLHYLLLVFFSRNLDEGSSTLSYHQWKLTVPPLGFEPLQIVGVIPQLFVNDPYCLGLALCLCLGLCCLYPRLVHRNPRTPFQEIPSRRQPAAPHLVEPSVLVRDDAVPK